MSIIAAADDAYTVANLLDAVCRHGNRRYESYRIHINEAGGGIRPEQGMMSMGIAAGTDNLIAKNSLGCGKSKYPRSQINHARRSSRPEQSMRTIIDV